ncbi:hypothetical protein ABIE67_008806 [Streptomyces sp. V4I8]
MPATLVSGESRWATAQNTGCLGGCNLQDWPARRPSWGVPSEV